MNRGRLARLRARWRERDDERGSVTTWLVATAAACLPLLALVSDGGTALRARSEAFSQASAAARAGAQQFDAASIVEGEPVLDPVAAEQAALAYLSAHGATGTVTVSSSSITVTVTTRAELHLAAPFGVDSVTFSATATVDAVKVEAS